MFVCSQDELFDKARGEILDEVLSLSQTSAQDWEQFLSDNLWESVKDHAMENIYLPAAQTGRAREFKTKVDILLKEWADKILPLYAVKVDFINCQLFTYLSLRVSASVGKSWNLF